MHRREDSEHSGGTLGASTWNDLGLALFMFVASGFLCSRYASHPGSLPLVWIPTTFGLVATLRLPKSVLPRLLVGFFLGDCLVGALSGWSGAIVVEFALWNILEILLGTWLMKRFVGILCAPFTIDEALKTLVVSMLGMAPAGAILGATSLHLHTGADWFQSAIGWWSGNATGIALFLLPGLAAGRREWRQFLTRRKLAEIGVATATCTAFALASLRYVATPFVFICLPFAILAVRNGLLHAAALVWICIGTCMSVYFAELLPPPHAMIHAGAATIWASATMTAFIPILIGIIVDQVKTQMAMLQSSESRFASILDSAATGFALLDGAGTILRSNAHLERIVGRETLDLVGLNSRDLIHPDDRAKFPERPDLALCSQGERLRFHRPDGVEPAGWGLVKTSSLAGGEGLFLLQVDDITGTVRVESDLENSRARLLTVIDNLPGMIGLWDRDLRNKFANRAYIDWFGLAPEEIEGRHISEVLGTEIFELNRPHMEAALRGETVIFERELRTAEGSRWSLATYVPDRQQGEVAGFYVMVTDMTPVKAAQQAQLDSLTRLGDIINGASEFSIIATDLQGNIQLFSHGAERMLGYSAEEMIGKHTPAPLHVREEVESRSAEIFQTTGRKVTGFDVFVDSASRGESESRVWTYVRKDGSTLPVQLVVTPLHNHQGVVDGYLGVARDIRTEQDAIRAIEEARSQAEHASLMKSEFVANMSHEIRTPMNAVLGMVQLMGKTSITPSQRKYLDMIRKSGRSLLGILDDILDFSKIEAGRMRIEPIDFLLDDVLENVANIASVNSSGKDLEISITVDPSVPVQLHGDSLRLQQVLVNLIGNATKFTMQGEVAMSIEVLSTDDTNTRIGFRIRDTGIGMTDEQQRRLFQPFSQVDSSNTRRFGGTGLGLTITKKLLDMMGGQIGVRSMSQIGTEFFLSLPFPTNHLSEPEMQAMSIRPLNILALEDHPSSQASLEASAVRWGWKIQFVTGIAEGMELLERRELTDPFDAVLVDGGLPDWDDRKCIERIRDLCEREITVVKMARTAIENPADEGIRMLDGILVKPITPLSLLKVLKNNLGHQVNEEDESRLHDERVAEDRKTLQGVRVLLVEDNAFNQVVATETLQALGAGVDLAENGKAAVERLRRAPDSYDVVLMDVQMPVMDGYAATRAIRQELSLKLPVVAMTAGVMPSDRDKCTESGMDDFISKPFEVDDLVKVFQKHVPLLAPKKSAASTPKRTGRRSVFQPDHLLQSLGNDHNSLRTVRGLVRQFLDTTPTAILKGREWAGRGDLEEATRTFHNLKSSSATLGAMAFASTAQHIELSLQESERRNLHPLFDQISEEYDRVAREAEIWLKSTDTGSITEPPTGWPEPGSKGSQDAQA